jgi:GNAT superfamily N-acetyltransferase
MSETLIRPVRPGDLAALTRMVGRLHRHPAHQAPGAWTFGSPRAITAALARDPAVLILVAERRGRLVGYLAGKIERRPRGWPRRAGHIMETFVAPAARRSGVGLALVGRFMEWLRKRKADDVKVGYVPGNREAGAFWTRLGFRPLVLAAHARPADLRKRIASVRSPLSSRR